MHINAVQCLLARARRNERGSVAIIFAFSIFALCGFIGLSIDASRAYSVAARTQAMLDTASLAAAKMLDVAGATDAEVILSASAFYSANLAGQKDVTATFENLVVTPHRGNQTVSVSVDVVVPTMFAGVVGFPNFRFKRDSMVIYKTRGVELAMVLDVTGSMNDLETGGARKIDAMKRAAKVVVSKLLDTTGGGLNTNRIALAPFSASVNVGSFRTQVSAGPSFTGDTCVIERPGAAATNDDAISGGTRARVITTDPSIAPQLANSKYSCPTSSIQPLTNSADTLNTQIDAYAPGGWTAGHLGMAWGWNLISPNFASIFSGSSTPAAYTDDTIIKSLVIMTDGDFNTAYKSGDASAAATQSAESNADFAALCTGMKAKGIKVYTIGFGLSTVPQPQRNAAKTLLGDCASDPGQFYDTETETELSGAFSSIADQLSTLRLGS
jgi:Flp pilus assembly protein TadG